MRKLVLLAALALAGCSSWWPFGSSAPAERPRWPSDAVVYRCDAGKQLVVQYLDGGKSAMVYFPEREFRLDPIVAASDARYSNGRTTLYTQGDEASLDDDGQRTHVDCKRAPK
ncbi:MAG: MliC family protein [Burkholderiales bacterium]